MKFNEALDFSKGFPGFPTFCKWHPGGIPGILLVDANWDDFSIMFGIQWSSYGELVILSHAIPRNGGKVRFTYA